MYKKNRILKRVFSLIMSLVFSCPAMANEKPIKYASADDWSSVNLERTLVGWEDFTKMTPENQLIQLLYMRFLTGVLEHADTANAELKTYSEFKMKLKSPGWLESVLEQQEAQAFLPAVIVAGRVGMSVAPYAYRMYQSYRIVGLSPLGWTTVTTAGGTGLWYATRDTTPDPAAIKAGDEKTGDRGASIDPIVQPLRPQAPPAQPAQQAVTTAQALPTTAAPAQPKPADVAAQNYRKAGALCIFGGHAASYSADKDGGCKAPEGTYNSKVCSATQKPNFKCNDFGASSEGQAMCIPIKTNSVASLTKDCVDAFQKAILDGKNKKVGKEAFDSWREKILAGIKAFIAKSNAQDPKITVEAYCAKKMNEATAAPAGRKVEGTAEPEYNELNKQKQKNECQAIYGLQKFVEDKGLYDKLASAPPAKTQKATK